MHVARRGNSFGDEVPAPGDYRTGCTEGEGIMLEVSWTSDTRVGGVSGLVDLFQTTFVFGINSSGYCSSTRQFIGLAVRRGRFDVRYVRGVWWGYEYRICTRWSVLSNFDIQSFSIRATVIGTGNYRQTAWRGGMSMFGALGGCGRHTDSVSVF